MIFTTGHQPKDLIGLLKRYTRHAMSDQVMSDFGFKYGRFMAGEIYKVVVWVNRTDIYYNWHWDNLK
jgi:hypothetical protein